MSDLELDLSMPSAQSVANRVIALKHVIVYALITPPRELLTKMSSAWSMNEREEFRKTSEKRRDEYWARLRQLDLHRELSPDELEFSKSTMLTMTDVQQKNASWRVEAFQVLLWALGYVKTLPPFYQMCDHQVLKDFPPADLRTFVGSAKLRSEDALEQFRQIAELWHWRCRTRKLIEMKEPLEVDAEMKAAGLSTYDDIVRFSAKAAHEHGDLPGLVDEDFEVNGKAFRDISKDEWASVSSIATERHFAANWLCGLAPSNAWDHTPTDT
jgi:hypothetical protein